MPGVIDAAQEGGEDLGTNEPGRNTAELLGLPTGLGHRTAIPRPRLVRSMGGLQRITRGVVYLSVPRCQAHHRTNAVSLED